MRHLVGPRFGKSAVLLLHVAAATFPPHREAWAAEHGQDRTGQSMQHGRPDTVRSGDLLIEVKPTGEIVGTGKAQEGEAKATTGRVRRHKARAGTGRASPLGAEEARSEARRGGGGERGRAPDEIPETVNLDDLREQMPKLSLEDIVQEHDADIRRKIREIMEEHGMDPSELKEPAKDAERTQKGFGVYESEHGGKIQMKVMHPGEFSAWRREPGRYNAMHMHEAQEYVSHHFNVAHRESRQSAMRKIRRFKEKAPTEEQAQFWEQQHEKMRAEAVSFTESEDGTRVMRAKARNATEGKSSDASSQDSHEKCSEGLKRGEALTKGLKESVKSLEAQLYFCVQVDIKLFSITGVLDGVYLHIGAQVAAKAPSLGAKRGVGTTRLGTAKRQAKAATGCWAFTFELSLGVSFGVHLPWGLSLAIGFSAFGTGTMEQKTFQDTGMSEDEWVGPSGCKPNFVVNPEHCYGKFTEVFWSGINELGLLVGKKSRPGKDALREALQRDGGLYAALQRDNWDLYTKIFRSARREPENRVLRVKCIRIWPAEEKLRCLIRTRTNTWWCSVAGQCYRNQYSISKESVVQKVDEAWEHLKFMEWREDAQAYGNVLLDHHTTVIEVGAGTTNSGDPGRHQVVKAQVQNCVAFTFRPCVKCIPTAEPLDLKSMVNWPAMSPGKHWLAVLDEKNYNGSFEIPAKNNGGEDGKTLQVEVHEMTRAGRLTVEVVEARKFGEKGEKLNWLNWREDTAVYAAVFVDPTAVLADSGPLFWTSISRGKQVKWWGEGRAWSIFPPEPWATMKARRGLSIALFSGGNADASSWMPPGAIEEWCKRPLRDFKDTKRCTGPCKLSSECTALSRITNKNHIPENCQCVAKNPTPVLRGAGDMAQSASDVSLVGQVDILWERLLHLLVGVNGSLSDHGAPKEVTVEGRYLGGVLGQKIKIKVRLAWTPDTSNIADEYAVHKVPQGQDKGKLVFAATGLKHAKAQFLAKVRKLSEQVMERVWDNTETDKLKNDLDCVAFPSCYMRSWDGIGGARLPRKASNEDKVAYKKGVDPSYWAADDRAANLAKALRETTREHNFLREEGNDEKVFISPTLVSDYAHSLKYYEAIAYSAANLFVRTVGDVQALFNVYFANQAQWDGLCSSLQPSFELPFESFAFAERPSERGEIPRYRYDRQVLEDPGDDGAKFYDKIQPRAALHEFPSRYIKGVELRDPGTDVDNDLLKEFYVHNPAADHLWIYGHGFRADEPSNNQKESMKFFTPDSPSVLSDPDDIGFKTSMLFGHEGDPSPTVYSRLWCDLAYKVFKKEVPAASQRNFDQTWQVTIGRNHGKQPNALAYQVHLGLDGDGWKIENGNWKVGPLFKDSVLWNANVREGDVLYAVHGKGTNREIKTMASLGGEIKVPGLLLPAAEAAGDEVKRWAKGNLPMTLHFSRPQDQYDAMMLEKLRNDHASSLAEEQPSFTVEEGKEGQKTAGPRFSGNLDANDFTESIKKVVNDAAGGAGRTLKIARACVDQEAKAESDRRCEGPPQRGCETVELNTPFITMFPHLIMMFQTHYEPKINDLLGKVQSLSAQGTARSQGSARQQDFAGWNETTRIWRELQENPTKEMMEYANELVYLLRLWLLDLGACGIVEGPLVEPLAARGKGGNEVLQRARMCKEIHEHLSGDLPGLVGQKREFKTMMGELFWSRDKRKRRVTPQGKSVLNMMHADFHAAFGVATAWPLAFQATKDAKANARFTGVFWKYLKDADPAARTADLSDKEAAEALNGEYLEERLQSKMEETLQKYNMAIQPQGEYLIKIPFVETTFTATIRVETAVPGFCTPNEAFLLMDKSWSWTIRSWDPHYRHYRTCNAMKVHPTNWALQVDSCSNAEKDFKEMRVSFLHELLDNTPDNGLDSIFTNTDLKDKFQSGNFFAQVDGDGFLGGVEGGLPAALEQIAPNVGVLAVSVWLSLKQLIKMASKSIDEMDEKPPPAPSRLFLETFEQQLKNHIRTIRRAKNDVRSQDTLDEEMNAEDLAEEEAQRKRSNMQGFDGDALPFGQIGDAAAEEDEQERAALPLRASAAAAAAAALQLRPQGAAVEDVMEEEVPAGPAVSLLTQSVGSTVGSSEHGIAVAQATSGRKFTFFCVLQGSISYVAHKRKRLNALQRSLPGKLAYADDEWAYADDEWTWRPASPEMSLELWLRLDPPGWQPGPAKIQPYTGLNIVMSLQGIWNTYYTSVLDCRRAEIVKRCKQCIEKLDQGWCDTQYMKTAEYAAKIAKKDPCWNNTDEQVCLSAIGWDSEGNMISGNWIEKGNPKNECGSIAEAKSGDPWVNADTFRNLEQRVLEKLEASKKQEEKDHVDAERQKKLKQEWAQKKLELKREKEEAELKREKEEANMFQHFKDQSIAAKQDKEYRDRALSECLKCVEPRQPAPYAFCENPDGDGKTWMCASTEKCTGVMSTSPTPIFEMGGCERKFGAVVGWQSQAGMLNRDKDICSACLHCTRAGKKFCSVDNSCEYDQDEPTTCFQLEATMLLGALEAVARPDQAPEDLNENRQRAQKLLERQCVDTGMTCLDKERYPDRYPDLSRCCLDLVTIRSSKGNVAMYKLLVSSTCPQRDISNSAGVSKVRLPSQGNVLDVPQVQQRCREFAISFLKFRESSAEMPKVNLKEQLSALRPVDFEDDIPDPDALSALKPIDFEDDIPDPDAGDEESATGLEQEEPTVSAWEQAGTTIWTFMKEKVLSLGSSTQLSAEQEEMMLPAWYYATQSQCEQELPECAAA